MIEILKNINELKVKDKYYANFDELHIKTD